VPPQQVIRWNVRVENVTTDPASVDISGGATGPDRANLKPGGPDHLLVDPSLKESVKKLEKNDQVTLIYMAKDDHKELKSFMIDTIDPPVEGPALALLGAFLMCFLAYYLLSGLHPMHLIVGEDNRYSNSKFQVALWFGVLIATYIATVAVRVWGAGGNLIDNVSIPTNLLLLSGLSAFSFGAAKGITTNKVNAALASGQADPKNSADAKPNLLLDLTHDDGVTAAAAGMPRKPMLDLGDFQMVVVTLLAVAVYLVLVYHFLGSIPKSAKVSLPDVDTTILATFGLGQGAYLTKKAVGNVGQS
jgi:hypothetical protein